MSIPESVLREIERAIEAAEFPGGMNVHDGKARVDSSHLRRLLAELAALRIENDALRDELQKVRRAAISGMDAATQHGRRLVQQAAKLRAESNPDALESERAANAMLTEQLQKAEAERDELRAAGWAALRLLDSVRVFVTTRERIHKPTGEEWFDGCVKALRAALGER